MGGSEVGLVGDFGTVVVVVVFAGTDDDMLTVAAGGCVEIA